MKFFNFAQVGALFASAILVGATAIPNPSLQTFTRCESSPSPSDGVFQNVILSYVNNIRSQHHANPLTWDTNITNAALRKANLCHLDHSVSHLSFIGKQELIGYCQGSYGENAFEFWMEPTPSSIDWTAKTRDAIDSWAKEKDLYNSVHADQANHFTQLVWKGSSKIGCAWTSHICEGNAHKDWWFYCDFDPSGNWSEIDWIQLHKAWIEGLKGI